MLMHPFPEYSECDEWVTWGRTLAYTTVGQWMSQYFMFILFGSLIAGISAYLVKTFAPYAASSGIPEVKTILGGFVIRGFLGGWTLLVGLVPNRFIAAASKLGATPWVARLKHWDSFSPWGLVCLLGRKVHMYIWPAVLETFYRECLTNMQIMKPRCERSYRPLRRLAYL